MAQPTDERGAMSHRQQPPGEEEEVENHSIDPTPELQLHTSSVTQQPLPLPPPPPEGRSWHFTAAFAGPSRVGKTKLIRRFTDSQFSDGYTETTSASPRSKAVAIGRHHVTFQCWDTPGQATLSRGLDRQLRFLHALFIVFDASRDCANELERWCRLAETCGPPRPMLVLVGNKTDLGQHPATLSRARQLAASSAPIFCLSVLADDENVEVDAMMLEVAKELTELHSRPLSAAEGSGATPGPAGEFSAAGAGLTRSSSSCDDTEADGDDIGRKGDGRKAAGVGAKVKEALAAWLHCCPSCC